MSTTHRGDTVYEKFETGVPREIVERAGWHKGDHVEFEIDRKGRVLMTVRQPIPKPRKLTYEEIRTALFNILLSQPNGLTWTEIYNRNQSLPKKPNQSLIQRLETDLGIRRAIGTGTGRKLYRMPTMPITSTH
jgi:bifunctional DNA-binding transcriptional regulator/antitoxin component of YhaV-PrlF toxin-antitoxin module